MTSESGPAPVAVTLGAVWWVYLLRCADDSLYTGITTNLDRRLAEHNGDGPAGARYTRSRRPVQLAWCEAATSRSEASQREAAIKRLDRARKLALCASQP
ncbi:MAG: GIY-YIG nuclease family protein [Thiobacillus sp.]|nr:GIY-YIG nuclease family protein [Thiobacillus sp.]MDP3124852.1 GIY-YIG nuclease family protein [Thiobacillus sp.]